jgi:hypothetical protein
MLLHGFGGGIRIVVADGSQNRFVQLSHQKLFSRWDGVVRAI